MIINTIPEYIPLEEEEQIDLVDWLETNGYQFTSIPNSTWTPSRKQKRKNYMTGLRSGLPDLMIIIPNHGLLFIEMKRKKGGVVSDNQQAWIDRLNKLKGVEAVVCEGAEAAKKYIQEFEK